MLALVLAASASAAVIPVTGGGSFAYDWTNESGGSVGFSGNDGVHSVALYAQLYSPYGQVFSQNGLSGGTSGLFSHNGGTATIDGLTSSSFRFSLSDSGSVDILGPDYNVIAHVDVRGYARITDQVTLNPGPFSSTSGSFTITPVPEPATLPMFGAALLLYGGYGLRSRHDQRIASGQIV